MKNIQAVFITLSVLFSSFTFANTVKEITFIGEYAPSEKALEDHLKSYPTPLKGQTGFIEVPLRYDNTNSAKMKIFYRLPRPIEKNKPTILYFYGGPGGSSIWSSIENGLPNFNVIYMDQRGTGFSRPETVAELKDPKNFSSEMIVKDSVRLLEKLEIQKVTVYGHSYGTIPATIFGSLHPDKAVAVVIEGVIFDGTKDLWAGSHRTKILNQFFKRLSDQTKNKILEISASGKVPSTWFSQLAQQAMYSNYFETSFSAKLDTLVALPDETIFQNINQETGHKFHLTDGAWFAGYMFHHIACQELSANEKGSSWGAEFVNGILIQSDLRTTDICESIAGMSELLNRTYFADKYPLNVPVTYIQGTLDGATVAPAAILHFKKVAKVFAQLILVKKAGHSPMHSCLSQGNADLATPDCPARDKLENLVNKIFLGNEISKEEIANIHSNKNWVMTSKK